MCLSFSLFLLLLTLSLSLVIALFLLTLTPFRSLALFFARLSRSVKCAAGLVHLLVCWLALGYDDGSAVGLPEQDAPEYSSELEACCHVPTSSYIIPECFVVVVRQPHHKHIPTAKYLTVGMSNFSQRIKIQRTPLSCTQCSIYCKGCPAKFSCDAAHFSYLERSTSPTANSKAAQLIASVKQHVQVTRTCSRPVD